MACNEARSCYVKCWELPCLPAHHNVLCSTYTLNNRLWLAKLARGMHMHTHKSLPFDSRVIAMALKCFQY